MLKEFDKFIIKHFLNNQRFSKSNLSVELFGFIITVFHVKIYKENLTYGVCKTSEICNLFCIVIIPLCHKRPPKGGSV